MFHAMFALFLLPFGFIHFLPTIVAAVRHSRHTLAIFMINVFLSWTVIGWVIALVWALTSEPRWVRAPYSYGYRRAW